MAVSLLEALDVRDEPGDLGLSQLALVGGHRGREALHELRLGVEDRFPDVVLVHGDRPAAGRLLLAEDTLPGWPDTRGAIHGVAGLAALLLVSDLSPFELRFRVEDGLRLFEVLLVAARWVDDDVGQHVR